MVQATSEAASTQEVIDAYRAFAAKANDRPELRALLDLSGKRAVVTGGGGKGLGQAVAHSLAAAGASVVLADINSDNAEAAAAEVRQRHGVRAIGVAANLALPDDASRVMTRCRDELGGLDILVNSAGGGGFGNFVEQTMADMMRIIENNLIAMLVCTHAASKVMVESGTRGAIVSVASQAGRLSWIRGAVYGACKAGVISATAKLSHELAPLGIRINAVVPGLMWNERHLSVLEHANEASTEYGFMAPQAAGAGAKGIAEPFLRTPARRPAAGAEVADVITFLASDAASYVHGASWDVAGGMG